MTKARARILIIAAACGGLLAVLFLYGIRTIAVHAAPRPPAALARLVPAKAPKSLPAATFAGAGGGPQTLGAFKGHYVLLNLWATWCAPCVKELPALARLQAGVPASRLSVVAVDVGRGTAAEAGAFLKAHGAGGLAVYVDPDLGLMRAFGAYGLPLSVLIDDRGREIARSVGPADWDAPDAIGYFKTLTASARP